MMKNRHPCVSHPVIGGQTIHLAEKFIVQMVANSLSYVVQCCQRYATLTYAKGCADRDKRSVSCDKEWIDAERQRATPCRQLPHVYAWLACSFNVSGYGLSARNELRNDPHNISYYRYAMKMVIPSYCQLLFYQFFSQEHDRGIFE